jgi:cell wall-associated NlpC family hydrolase
MALFRSFVWMVAIRGQAAVSRGGTAPAPTEPRPEAATARRAWLLTILSGGVALGLQGCGSAPVRRSADTTDPEFDTDDLDLTDGGPGSEVVMQALANVGKPYRWGGTSPEDGFDCSGLVAHVYEDAVGIKLPRTSRQMSRRGTRVDRRHLAAGDLVFFHTSRHAYSHVGIYIGKGRFVHAPSTGSLVRVERMSNRYWATRYDGARRML